MKIELGTEHVWHQCQKCTYLSAVTWRGSCVNCGDINTKPLDIEKSDYLRARKTFWRDPILKILAGSAKPFNLNVCEHTAQLSYRDQEEIKSTTEEYERLFKDILIRENEFPVDMLSSTTTMEVGIDIGSLIAVALRNVPPQRQNYQQRVGRTGRRGAAISTVMTYAQNSPHDYFYFRNINKIIAGDPPSPAVDINNARLISRHVHAALFQQFFHTQVVHVGARSSDIFSTLGATWDFYNDDGDFTLRRFREWIREDATKDGTLERIQNWIPIGAQLSAEIVAQQLIKKLQEYQPAEETELEGNGTDFIDFLFLRGLLPSYAFPKDLCALQIESLQRGSDNRLRVKILEKPQQSLNVALSEYAPGRIVVVDKLTYRIGAVGANRLPTVTDRAAPLFQKMKSYHHCHDCSFTQTATEETRDEASSCLICGSINYKVIDVIQPEVVFPQGKGPVDELDDEQVFSTATSAQLPVPRKQIAWNWQQGGKHSRFAYAENQPLVMLNKGKFEDESYTGFLVCEKCGHSVFPDALPVTPHVRHYDIEFVRGSPTPPSTCNGQYRHVSLGYSFMSDLLLFEVTLNSPLDTDITAFVSRKALEDSLRSLCEALCLAACETLDIDRRELNGGFRLMNRNGVVSADIFLYDTVSGGAGYSAMVGGQFIQILQETKEILEDCTCDKSCDKCLRHYGNKHHHSSLNRWLALTLLEYAVNGKLPEIKGISEQASELASLRKILEMAGWVHEVTSDVPLQVKREDKILKFATCPTLLDARAAGHTLDGVCEVINSYRLQNNLAGVFADIGT